MRGRLREEQERKKFALENNPCAFVPETRKRALCETASTPDDELKGALEGIPNRPESWVTFLGSSY